MEHPSQGAFVEHPIRSLCRNPLGTLYGKFRKSGECGPLTDSTFHLLLRAGPFLSWDSLLSGDFLDLSRGSGEALSGGAFKEKPKGKNTSLWGSRFSDKLMPSYILFWGQPCPQSALSDGHSVTESVFGAKSKSYSTTPTHLASQGMSLPSVQIALDGVLGISDLAAS